MTPEQQEEIHLSNIALDSARKDVYNCEQRIIELHSELAMRELELDRLKRVVERAEIGLSKAKSAAKKKGAKGKQ